MSTSKLMVAVSLSLSLVACSITINPGGGDWGLVVGSGEEVTESQPYSDFDQLVIDWGFRAQVQQGEEFSVEVTVQEELVPYLEITKSGSVLRIGLQSGHTYQGTREVAIVMPAITGLEANGGSRVTLTGFESQASLWLEVSGGSSLVGDIAAGDTTLDASGGSTVTLTGTAADMRIDASGGSQVDLEEFAGRDATLIASGGGTVVVNCSGKLSVQASGGSRVYYVGDPTIESVDVSGGSTIQKK